MRPLIVLLPALALALLGGCDRQKAAQPQGETADAAPVREMGRLDISHRGEAMPAVPFEGPGGAPATLTGFRGRPLLVNLWATWCAPCVKEMPTLDRLAGEADGAYQLVVVSQDMEGKRAVAPFFAKAGFANLKPYIDKQNVLMQAYSSDTLPMTILYDAKGREQWRVLGNMDWSGERAKTLIAGALKPAA